MRFKVIGVDRESGVDRMIWVSAVSSDAATLLAGEHNMIVASAVEDMPAIQQVVAKLPAGPITVRLDGTQLKQLRVGEMRIATGVFLGLLFWTIFVFLISIIFWILLGTALFSLAA